MDDFFAANGAKHLLVYYEHIKEVDTGKATHQYWLFNNYNDE